MKLINKTLPFLTVLCVNAYAFEFGTHARITHDAYDASILKKDIFTNLGLPLLESKDKTYYDNLLISVPKERKFLSFIENKIFYDLGEIKPTKIDVDMFSPKGWMMRGVIREDDAPPEPSDDGIIPNEMRVFNHFYDPISDSPFNIGLFKVTPCNLQIMIPGAVSCAKNPDWALGLVNREKNRYSILDAREAQYRALTGEDSKGNAMLPGNELKEQLDIRKGYTATMFRALGDVLHMVQDLAQPQHTRNEAHTGVGSKLLQYNIVGVGSFFELYTEQRALEQPYKIPNTTEEVKTTAPRFTGYPTPKFKSYREIFTSRDIHADVKSRTGLADFSNREFFTAGKNINNDYYASPDPSADAYLVSNVTINDEPGSFQMLYGQITDALNPGQSTGTYSFPMAAYGIWDEFLRENNKPPRYSLTKVNYDAMADQLLPRATAYSAGLLDYFFRGKIEMLRDKENPHTCIIKNTSDEAMNGTFSLYYDDNEKKRHPVPGAKWNLSISAKGEIKNISVTKPTTPAPSGDYILVFNGTMGEEKPTENSIGTVASYLVPKLATRLRQVYDYEGPIDPPISGSFAETFYDRFELIDYSSGEVISAWSSVFSRQPVPVYDTSMFKLTPQYWYFGFPDNSPENNENGISLKKAREYATRQGKNVGFINIDGLSENTPVPWIFNQMLINGFGTIEALPPPGFIEWHKTHGICD